MRLCLPVFFIWIPILLLSCGSDSPHTRNKSLDADQGQQNSKLNIKGTWRLLNGTLVEKGDTTVTIYGEQNSFIKILNDTHFAFLLHDLKKGQDSTNAFSAGGGTYSLVDHQYTEHLEYCSARNWEGHDFTFSLELKGDTLIQRGIERIESSGIERLNIEQYVRQN